MNAIVYDLEIEKAILGRGEIRLEGIEYAAGFDDHANLGVSVIGVYDFATDRSRVFCKDNFDEFRQLVADRDLLIGFNSIPFDNAVLKHVGIEVPEDKCMDLLREIWLADGLGPKFVYPTHAGYSLDAVMQLNFGEKKSGNGALAPIWWQRGEIGKVMDYCVHDCHLEAKLFKLAISGKIVSPKNNVELKLRDPFAKQPETT